MQLAHRHYTPAPLDYTIVLICDHIQSPANMGSIFRLCDAFGIKEIVFTGNAPDTKSGRFKSTSRSAEKYVHFRKSENILTTLEQLHEQMYTSIAIEITDQSVPIQTLQMKINKIALVIGNESLGVQQEVLEKVHRHAHISMFGKNSSMNVAHATAIAFYELTRS